MLGRGALCNEMMVGDHLRSRPHEINLTNLWSILGLDWNDSWRMVGTYLQDCGGGYIPYFCNWSWPWGWLTGDCPLLPLWEGIPLVLSQLLRPQCVSFNHIWLSGTPWTIAHQSTLSMEFSKNTEVSCHFLLQGIFLTQDQTQVSCIAGRFFTIWAQEVTQIFIR